MAFLLDTSILVRLANTNDTRHPVAAGAVLELDRRSETLHITPQVLIEFRNVATQTAQDCRSWTQSPMPRHLRQNSPCLQRHRTFLLRGRPLLMGQDHVPKKS